MNPLLKKNSWLDLSILNWNDLKFEWYHGSLLVKLRCFLTEYEILGLIVPVWLKSNCDWIHILDSAPPCDHCLHVHCNYLASLQTIHLVVQRVHTVTALGSDSGTAFAASCHFPHRTYKIQTGNNVCFTCLSFGNDCYVLSSSYFEDILFSLWIG